MQSSAGSSTFLLYLDPSEDDVHTWITETDIRNATRWGYGFSYVYIRSVALSNPFTDRSWGEDSE